MFLFILVITGATDGIGRGYALEFARLGINVILISRTESKLIKVTNEIESLYPSVKVRWIVADFAKGENIYENLKAELESIPIGILGEFYYLQGNAHYPDEKLEVRLCPIKRWYKNKSLLKNYNLI